MPSATEILYAVAEPNRIKLLTALLESPEPIQAGDFGKVVNLLQPTISHHLKTLRQAGLIFGERRRSYIYYRIPEELRGYVRAIIDSSTAISSSGITPQLRAA